MRVLESSEAGVSPGRPVSLGKCCIYTHPNYCLRPPCSSVLPSGLMNKALRVEAPECEVVAPSLSLLASTICIWASVPWSANTGHWVILREVLARVLGAVRLLQVFAHHHHQDLRHLVLRAGIEILRAARSTTDPAAVSPTYSSRNHLPNTSYGNRAVPGTVWGNQANRTKSDLEAAVSHFFLSDPLTFPYSPVGFGASSALLST